MHLQIYFGAILLVCWVVFVGYWIYSAKGAKRTIGRPFFGTGIAWRLVIVLAVIVVAKFQPRILLQTFISFSPWWGVVGCVLAVAGVAIAIWARYYLGRNWGMPMSVKENAELVTGGPYQWVRNPIYTGVILALLGSGLVAGVWWLVICSASIVYFILSVFQEERIMLKTFPNSYPQYKAHTWRLIPFVF